MSVNVLSYGAALDGTTNDAASIATAFATGQDVYIPYTSAGCYISSSITLSNPGEIFGDNGTTLKIAPSMTTDLFNVQSNTVRISKLHINGNSTQNNSLFKLKTSYASLRDICFEEIYTSYCCHLLTDDNSTNDATGVHLKKIYHRQPTGRTSLLYNAASYLFMDNVFTDLVGTTNNVPAHGILNNNGCVFDTCEVDGGTSLGSSQWGFDFENCAAVTMLNCQADTLGGYGFRFCNVSYAHLTDIKASLCNGHGLLITGSTGINGRGIYTGGRNYLSGASGSAGIYVTGASSKINLSNIITENNTSDGLIIDNANGGASQGIFADLAAHNNGNYGYLSSSASSSLLNGARMSGNVSGDYLLYGTTNIIANVLTNANAFIPTAHG